MKLVSFLTLSVALCSTTLFSTEDGSEVAFAKKRKEKREVETTCPVVEPEEPICCELVCCEIENHRIQVGGNYTYAWITPTANPTTRGNLYGVQGLYEYRPVGSIYAAAAFNWRRGNTENGTLNRDIQDFDVQERVGYTFGKICGHSRLAIFAGFGGRYLPEEVSIGATSVDFNYVELYVPVGFVADYEFTSWFNVGLNFQWKPQVYADVDIEPLSGARWIIDRKTNNFFVEMPITFHDINHFSLIVSPFFEIWHDGATTAVTTTGLALGLPGNRYYFTGVNVNLGFSF